MERFTTFDRAKEVMGSRAISPEDVESYLDIKYDPEDLGRLKRLPSGLDLLRRNRETTILVPGIPVTICDLRDRYESLFFLNKEISWYNDEPFASCEQVEARWYLLLRNPLHDPRQSGTIEELAPYLPGNVYVPRACEMVFGVILAYLATGERIFGDAFVRCRDFALCGERVNVGPFRSGLSITYSGDQTRYVAIGVTMR